MSVLHYIPRSPCPGSILILLLRQVKYLYEKRHSLSAVETLAVLHSLPYAFLTWAWVLFLCDIQIPLTSTLERLQNVVFPDCFLLYVFYQDEHHQPHLGWCCIWSHVPSFHLVHQEGFWDGDATSGKLQESLLNCPREAAPQIVLWLAAGTAAKGSWCCGVTSHVHGKLGIREMGSHFKG